MSRFYIQLKRTLLLSSMIAAASPAQSFTISDGETVTATQTLSVDGETGLIISGGIIDASGTAQRKAVSITADNVTVTNNGSLICRKKVDCVAIGNQSNITVINNGSITVSQENGDGVAQNSGSNFTFINNGNITTSGSTAETVINFGDNGSITNNGTLETTGSTQNVFTEGDGDRVTNNGTITASANNASAIIVGKNAGSGVNPTITNNNIIRVTGSGSVGILLVNASGTTINNSGLISGEQSATAAIDGSDNAETLNLLSGSQIIGTIDLDAGTDTVNISGANNSSTLTLTDVETINIINGNGLLVSDVVTMVDPTGQSVSSAVLSDTTFAVHNVVNQRLSHHEALKPIQVATSELTSGMVFQERAPQIWGSMLGTMRERDLEGIALAYEHNYVGFSGGYEVSFHKARIGLLGGFVNSKVKTTGDKFGRARSVDTDSDSFFVGAYSQYFLGRINLTTILMAGYEEHENDRAVVDNINGFETAQAEFFSFFISPSLTLSSAYSIGERIELRPSVTLAYSVDDRNVHALTGQVQLAAAYPFFEKGGVEFRTGTKARYSDDADIDLSLAGTDFRIPNASDDSVYGGYVGINAQITIANRMNLVADFEHGRASGGEKNITAFLKLQAAF
jgi:hypothetical protein